jgi:hypothetical protein
MKLLADDTEITELPFLAKEGQNIILAIVPETRTFPAGVRVVLTPEEPSL